MGSFDENTSKLLISVFILIILDKTYALYNLNIKALRIIIKTPKTDCFERKLLVMYTENYLTIFMVIYLICTATMMLIQVLNKETFATNLGKAVYAFLGFLLSMFATSISICTERLDLKLQGKAK